ncbi:Hypothetical protein, conserved [Brucella abortus str. 2308 A]|uniref:Uncharacterized protein n=1 Tax=Brucella ceti str. Cudo TaxID=595497 RepID=C0GB28_9HYPH|nr:hypothetical protein BMNI_II0994 [Brucella melitensis NI]EEH13046.1 Hypothetical protein, conserved [Brucella ceti str. Cudo]EEP62451.1 Hypothetical protein, conserved [Brucella abortus str. 2308 A]
MPLSIAFSIFSQLFFSRCFFRDEKAAGRAFAPGRIGL